MDADLTLLQQRLRDWLAQIGPFVIWVRDRISVETMVFAVVAAAGALIAFIGVTSYRRIKIAGEMALLEGVEQLGLLERLQIKLDQSGLRLRVHEFLAVGFLMGGGIGAVFILLGFLSLGLMFIASGPFIYFQLLMNRRAKEVQRFREELPIAILDMRDSLNAKNDLQGALTDMAYSGPQSVRPYFEQAVSLVTATNNLSQALREVAHSREEPFFRQFFDCLANHHKGGRNTAEVLTRIARGQKTQTRLQSKTRARQSGIRVVGAAYMVAPGGMALFMRFFGGSITADFYLSPVGQLVQIGAALTGVISYWLSGRIARRGLYIDEVSTTRIDTSKVPALITADEFGGDEPEWPSPNTFTQPEFPESMPPIEEEAAAQTGFRGVPMSPVSASAAMSDTLLDEPEVTEEDTQPMVWPALEDDAEPIDMSQFAWGALLQDDPAQTATRDSSPSNRPNEPTPPPSKADDEPETGSF